MTESGRRAQRTEESRRKILEATLELAAEHGYEGTTIGKVSERSGLPTGSVYWHFESKDKLFGSLLEHCVTEWEARQQWTHRGRQPSRERFEKLIALRSAEASGPASFWRLGILLALEQRLAGTAARQTFLDIRRTRLADITGWWEHLLPGRVRAADPGLAARLAQFTMATADGLCVASGAGEDWDHSALAGMLLDALRHLVDDAVGRASAAE
ncbi:MAG: TetR/AcrR family transcriptional regulator [Streptosporangiales bacterium]|nr:TetR/AcrR family transcriptional regulator [Streptosporangiales bacterium]